MFSTFFIFLLIINVLGQENTTIKDVETTTTTITTTSLPPTAYKFNATITATCKYSANKSADLSLTYFNYENIVAKVNGTFEAGKLQLDLNASGTSPQPFTNLVVQISHTCNKKGTTSNTRVKLRCNEMECQQHYNIQLFTVS